MATAKLSKSDPQPLPRVTKAMLEEYCQLDNRRKQLNRDAAAIAKKLEPITASLQRFVDEKKKGKAREVTTCGHRLSILEAPDVRCIKWKSVCIKLAGEEAVAKVEADPPLRTSLEVLPV